MQSLKVFSNYLGLKPKSSWNEGKGLEVGRYNTFGLKDELNIQAVISIH